MIPRIRKVILIINHPKRKRFYKDLCEVFVFLFYIGLHRTFQIGFSLIYSLPVISVSRTIVIMSRKTSFLFQVGLQIIIGKRIADTFPSLLKHIRKLRNGQVITSQYKIDLKKFKAINCRFRNLCLRQKIKGRISFSNITFFQGMQKIVTGLPFIKHIDRINFNT